MHDNDWMLYKHRDCCMIYFVALEGELVACHLCHFFMLKKIPLEIKSEKVHKCKDIF